MKKTLNVIAITLVIVLLCIPANAAYTAIGLENFTKAYEYSDDQFTDVSSNSWYAQNVESVFEHGLMAGVETHLFSPESYMTVAQAITISARINNIYIGGDAEFLEIAEGDRWFDVYLRYTKSQGIITTDYPDYNAPATRAQFAKILAASINPLDFEEINWIDDGAIPDVPTDADYADAVYMLYRAGVLAGSDSAGNFNPNSTITRAETAAIITRIVDPNLRQTIELNGSY